MSDRIKDSYKASKNIYDDILTRKNIFAKLYMKLFWQDVDDNKIAEELLKYIPDKFRGKLLDVPVGTGVFTCEKYKRMTKADITCLDYSEDMLVQARTRFLANDIGNVTLVQGDVGALPFEDGEFDVLLSMNGFHAFPDKNRAFSEMTRVLKKGGKLVACFYIRGRSKVTDALVKNVLAKKGWFTPPFDTSGELMKRLERAYEVTNWHIRGSMVYFKAIRK
ncbi:MAG: class I SAM-dependent methyltransferase [Ruminiclostridium sp.]|nr:class I SAM-dependent methyltransferase [Ruminiclostridium sp.]